MNTVKRWITILLTCRLGWHSVMTERPLSEGVKALECTRCHRTTVMSRSGGSYAFSPPNAWDVARGLYDRPQDEWKGH